MHSTTIRFIVLSVIALVVFSAPISAQNQPYPFPEYRSQFAPSRPSRPDRQKLRGFRPTKSRIRFPNQYLVVLNDDRVRAGSASEELLRKCEEPARKHARKSTVSSGRPV